MKNILRDDGNRLGRLDYLVGDLAVNLVDVMVASLVVNWAD